MAKSVNKVILVGNLGKDPEVKYTAGGTAVATVTVATSENFKDKQTNEWQERTEWHNVVLWQRLAEIAKEYLRKGNKVYIEGRLQTRSWEDKQGQKRYTTEVVANEMVLLGGRNDGGSGSGGGYQQRRSNNDYDQSNGGNFGEPATQITDDDIPF